MKNELSRLLNVSRRNPMFTNREAVLANLEENFKAVHAVVALCGLSGVGKTQLALEYAYRNYQSYQAVLWVNAKLQVTFNSDILSIATFLNSPAKSAQDQEVIIRYVKRWLQYDAPRPWLLILDNAEDFSLIQNFISPFNEGHILITTQLQALDPGIQIIELGRMEPEAGALLLLRRARIIPTSQFDVATPSDLLKAKEISLFMGGLPLALDQAGAYIEETACSLSDYIELYHLEHSALLKRRGGFLSSDSELIVHPESVDTALSLSFEKIEKTHAFAAEVLLICAFLYPDSIPEAIVTDAIASLNVEEPSVDSRVLLKTALRELAKLSLIQWNTSAETISMHPLMQIVLKDRMDETQQKKYATLAVKAISHTFPPIEFFNWPHCQLWLAQARVALSLVKQWNIETLDTAHLFHEMAYYSWLRALYTRIDVDLEELYEKAIALQKKIVGDESALVATSLYSFALLCRDRGKYNQAEQLFMQSLKVRLQLFGSVHPDIAASLNELGGLYRAQGKYKEAEEPLKQALIMREQTLAPDHQDLAASLNALGSLYRYLGKYDDAERLLGRALELREKVLDPGDPRIAQTLTYLAWLYYDRGDYQKVQALLDRSLEIQERALGLHHPQVAYTLNYLGLLSCIQGKYAQAEKCYQTALEIRRELLGPDHPDVAQTLSNLGLLRYHQNKYDEAEHFYLEAQKIREHLSPLHPEVSQTMNRLAQLYEAQGKYEQAEELYQRAVAIREQILGPDHPHVANCLNNLAELYMVQQRYEQAERLFLRALSIRQQTQGAEHQLVAQTLNNLAQLYQAQGNYLQAEQYYQQALNIYQKIFDPHHPDIANLLENYASMLKVMKREDEAIQMELLARAIRDQHAQENQSDINDATSDQ